MNKKIQALLGPLLYCLFGFLPAFMISAHAAPTVATSASAMAAAPVAVVVSAPAPDRFMRKVDKDRTLVLERVEVLYVPPSEAEKEQLAKDFPGAKYSMEKPANVGQYSLVLISTDPKSRKVLWQKTIPDFSTPPEARPAFHLVDVYFDGIDTAVLYQHYNILQAEVMTPAKSFDSDVVLESRILFRESQDSGPTLDRAKFQGSLKKDNLAVTIWSEQGDIIRWFWQNEKWVPHVTEGPKELFAKPVTFGGNKTTLKLTVDPQAKLTSSGDIWQKFAGPGTLAVLYETPTPREGDAPAAVSPLRKSFGPTYSLDPRPWWSGDAVVLDGKAYVVVADGSKFWLQIIDLATKAPEGNSPAVSAAMEAGHFSVEGDIDTRPDEKVMKDVPFIESIAIKSQGNDLVVSLNGQLQKQFVYSLKKHTWSISIIFSN